VTTKQEAHLVWWSASSNWEGNVWGNCPQECPRWDFSGEMSAGKMFREIVQRKCPGVPLFCYSVTNKQQSQSVAN